MRAGRWCRLHVGRHCDLSQQQRASSKEFSREAPIPDPLSTPSRHIFTQHSTSQESIHPNPHQSPRPHPTRTISISTLSIIAARRRLRCLWWHSEAAFSEHSGIRSRWLGEWLPYHKIGHLPTSAGICTSGLRTSTASAGIALFAQDGGAFHLAGGVVLIAGGSLITHARAELVRPRQYLSVGCTMWCGSVCRLNMSMCMPVLAASGFRHVDLSTRLSPIPLPVRHCTVLLLVLPYSLSCPTTPASVYRRPPAFSMPPCMLSRPSTLLSSLRHSALCEHMRRARVVKCEHIVLHG